MCVCVYIYIYIDTQTIPKDVWNNWRKPWKYLVSFIAGFIPCFFWNHYVKNTGHNHNCGASCPTCFHEGWSHLLSEQTQEFGYILCISSRDQCLWKGQICELWKCVRIYWYIKLLDFSEIVSYTETARSTFPIVNPRSCCVVFVVSIPFPILEISRQIQVLRGETVSLTPNPQPGGPGYPFLSGSSPMTCLTRDAIPVASLLPA